MATIPPLRPLDNGSTDEPGAVLRGASPVRTAAAIAAAAAIFLLVVVIAGVGRLDADVSFLEDALGPERAEAPLQRTPAPGVDVRINPEGYTVSHWGASVSVVSEDVGGARWRNHVHGVTRETEFGSETIVVDGARTEKFLTVTERQGEKTWRWKLATRLVPRLGNDGAVSFADTKTNHVTSLVIDPVQILDRSGKEITPEGLRWDLEKTDSGWWLTLDLDDAELPLPYVIDPAVTYRLAQATSNTAGGATTLVLNMPAGVVQKDLIVAAVCRPRGTSATVTTPAGWNAPSQRDQRHDAALRNLLAQSPPTPSPRATHAPSRAARPASGRSAASRSSTASRPPAPLDVNGLTNTNTGTTATANSITTTATNSRRARLLRAAAATPPSRTPAGLDRAYDMQQLERDAGQPVALDSPDKLMAAVDRDNNAASTVSSGQLVGHAGRLHRRQRQPDRQR